MSQDKEKEIIVESKLSAKESPKLKKIEYKSVAGLTKEEIIERHIIGELDKERDTEESEEKEG